MSKVSPCGPLCTSLFLPQWYKGSVLRTITCTKSSTDGSGPCMDHIRQVTFVCIPLSPFLPTLWNLNCVWWNVQSTRLLGTNDVLDFSLRRRRLRRRLRLNWPYITRVLVNEDQLEENAIFWKSSLARWLLNLAVVASIQLGVGAFTYLEGTRLQRN